MSTRRGVPRRQSLNASLDIFAQTRNRFTRIVSATSSLRPKRTSVSGPNSRSISKFNDALVRVSESLLTLYIPESKLKNFVDALKSVQFCGTNAIRSNGSGDVFHTEWNTFCESITDYLKGPIITRCKDYITDELNRFSAALKILAQKIPMYGPYKSRLISQYNEMKIEISKYLVSVS